MNRATSIIFRNVRGANNDDFRRNFRELIDTHRPCMITLLETRMTAHAKLLNDFNFSELIEVLTCGMAILYNHNLITVQHFTRRGQEIHTIIEVRPYKTQWLFTSIYARTKSNYGDTMWENLISISENYKGP